MPARRVPVAYSGSGGFFSAADRHLCPRDCFTGSGTYGSADMMVSSIRGSIMRRRGMLADTATARLTNAAIVPASGAATLRGRHRLQRMVDRPEFSGTTTPRRYQLFVDEANNLGSIWYDPATDDTKAIVAGRVATSCMDNATRLSQHFDEHSLFPYAGRGRLISIADKWGFANGGRNTLSANGWVLATKFSKPDVYDGVPARWNGQEYLAPGLAPAVQAPTIGMTLPVGHIPPINPVRFTHHPLAGGSWAVGEVYYTYLYEWEDGSLSPPVQWRPRGSATMLPNGWCKFSVPAVSDYVDITEIGCGPRGVKARWLLRSPVAATADPALIQLCHIIENNTQTSYRDYFGSDDALSNIADVLSLDPMWMPEARYAWSFDQRIACGHTRPNRGGILISVVNGDAVTSMLNSDIYAARNKYSAVLPANAQTIKEHNDAACDYSAFVQVTAGAASLEFYGWDGKRGIPGAPDATQFFTRDTLTLAGLTLQDVVDHINNRSDAITGWGGGGGAPWASATLHNKTKGWNPAGLVKYLRFYAQLVPGADPSAPATSLAPTDTTDFGDQFSLVTGGGAVTYYNGLAPGGPSLQRVLGNMMPGLLVMSEGWAKLRKRQTKSVFFTGSNPGAAPNAMNNWYAENERTILDEYGDIVGGASLLSGCLVLSTRGVNVIRNIRDTKTGADQDYRIEPIPGAPGCIAPDSIAECNGVVLYLSDQGLMACDGERFECLSTRIYNEASQVGEWAYEIAACKAASEADTDDSYFGCTIIGQRLWVWYRYDSSGFVLRRMMCLDFSASRATSGMAQFLDDSGKAFGWSAPLTIPLTCVNQYHDGTSGKLFGIYEGGSGRVDQFDVGLTDVDAVGNETLVVGYAAFVTDFLGTDRKKSLRNFVATYKNTGAATLYLAEYRDLARSKVLIKSLAATAAGEPKKERRFDASLAAQSPAEVVEFMLTDTGTGTEIPEFWGVTAAVDVLEPIP